MIGFWCTTTEGVEVWDDIGWCAATKDVEVQNDIGWRATAKGVEVWNDKGKHKLPFLTINSFMYSNENKKDGQIRMKFEKVQFVYIDINYLEYLHG